MRQRTSGSGSATLLVVVGLLVLVGMGLLFFWRPSGGYTPLDTGPVPEQGDQPAAEASDSQSVDNPHGGGAGPDTSGQAVSTGGSASTPLPATGTVRLEAKFFFVDTSGRILAESPMVAGSAFGPVLWYLRLDGWVDARRVESFEEPQIRWSVKSPRSGLDVIPLRVLNLDVERTGAASWTSSVVDKVGMAAGDFPMEEAGWLVEMKARALVNGQTVELTPTPPTAGWVLLLERSSSWTLSWVDPAWLG